MLVIQEAEIRRIAVRSQPGQIVLETLSQKTLYKTRAGGVAQGEGLNSSPSTEKKERKKEKKKAMGRPGVAAHICNPSM
jgi:hypothetical protein